MATETINDFVDYWRYNIGVNVIPADTQNKRPIIPWDQWQDKPVPEELHNEWKAQGIFSKGIALIPGKVWHRPDKSNLYFVFIDADKQKAIDELCTRNGKTTTLQEMSQKFIVEQHKDNLDKAHIYFYSSIPFPKKSADSVLGLEVKGLGEHGIAYCTCSIHKDGQPYEIMGTTEPVILTEDLAKEFRQHIDTICKKHGIEYLDKHYKNLLDSDSKIYQGERHDSMISIANSILFRYYDNNGSSSTVSSGKSYTDWQLKDQFVIINYKRCVPPLPTDEINQIWKDAVAYHAREKSKQKEEEEQHSVGATNVINEDNEEFLLATQNKLTTQDIEFVINTIKKEAEYDELSIRQLFYGMGSAFTKRPIHHTLNSKESGAGKSYLLERVSSYYPDRYVIPLGRMSDKALFHRRGIMMRANEQTGQEQPIIPILNSLYSEADDVHAKIHEERDKEKASRNKDLIKKSEKRLREIESQIDDIKSNAQKVIDLNNQIILCLDTPQDSLYDAIMSIISQDTPKDQQYSFVDKTSSGRLVTKDNKMRGTPVIFFTQVIDDTKTQRFGEKNRRFVNVNPDTSNEKIHAAKDIIGLQGGYLPDEYDDLVVSRRDKERAKQIVNILVAKLKQHTKRLEPKEYGVKIPFALSVTASIPDNHLWSMTITDRTIKYLSVITKMNMDSRPRLVNEQTGQFYPISTFDDLKQTLNLMQVGASGVRPYLVDWYNNRFIGIYNDLDGQPYEDKKFDEDTGKYIVIGKEKRPGLTTKQIADRIKEEFGGIKQSSEELRKKYLYPLINQGIIDYVQSEINRRENIYFPVEEDTNLFHIFDDSTNDLRLKVPTPDIFPSKNFLEGQFRILSKYSAEEGSDFTKKIYCYKLIDVDGSEISLDQLIEKYFNNPDDCFVKAYKEETNDNNKTAEEGL
jgi:Bifunctional DNA primase/polymerase, N-terminal